jgi:hypothetical protein
MVLQSHSENGIFPLSTGKIQWLMSRALFPEMIPPGDTGPRGVVGVIGPVGALEAIVVLLIGQFWYSEAHHLEEIVVYIDPKHRKKAGHFKTIIKWMKEQSENTGLPLLTGVMSHHRLETKCELYRKMLPKLGEFFFVTPKGSNLSLVAASS